MSCDCDSRAITWDDDAPEMCEHCLAQMLAETSRFEPADDPQPADLLPDPDTSAIDSVRVNPESVKRLVGCFLHIVDNMRETPREGAAVSDRDVLAGIEAILRLYVSDTVLCRAEAGNPTAAVTNRAAIVTVLSGLITEIQKLDLPNPKVN